MALKRLLQTLLQAKDERIVDFGSKAGCYNRATKLNTVAEGLTVNCQPLTVNKTVLLVRIGT